MYRLVFVYGPGLNTINCQSISLFSYFMLEIIGKSDSKKEVEEYITQNYL